MIVTPRFVFLHLHKSGGSFVNESLLRFVPGARQVGYHLPRSMVPAEHAHLPAVGFVRNPWSYYVSWYAFQSPLPQPNALYRILSEDGRLDFDGTVRNMVTMESTPHRLDAVIASLPASYTRRGLNLPGPALRSLRGSGLGFYSFLYRYMFDGEANLKVGRMEELRTDLLRLLADCGETVIPELRAYVSAAAPINGSHHRPYAEYYDESLRDLVASHDAALIERFGYRFGE